MIEKTEEQKIGLPNRVASDTLGIIYSLAKLSRNKSSFDNSANRLNSTSLRYRRLHLPYDAREGSWIHYDGVKKSGIIPLYSGAAAIILVDRDLVENARSLCPGGHETVSYKLGSSVMYGTSNSSRQLLSLEHPDSEDYQIAVRIGSGSLEAQIGQHLSYKPGCNTYVPFEHGVRKGPVVSVDDVPSSILVV
jgi:hypothetical protein